MKAKDIMNVYSTIGDLKEIDYRNTLAIATMIKLLIDKGIISEEEFRWQAAVLDLMDAPAWIQEPGSAVPGSRVTGSGVTGSQVPHPDVRNPDRGLRGPS